jgi:two-component system chemotaxis response regulator CheY
MRKIQRRTLERLGFTDIIEAEDGDEALRLLPDANPDILITDWNMPNVNGLELVRQIRQTDQKLPIIMVTTEAEKNRVIEAIKAGISDYLIKPFTGEALASKIRRVTNLANEPAGV